MKVLIVDDSAIMRMMLKSMLAQLDLIDVIEAGSGTEGIEALRKTPVSLVLLDLHMPQMDGFGFLEATRQDPSWMQIPVVIVSSDSDKEQVERALQMGARSYGSKPFHVRGLREALGKVVPFLQSS
jgi:CheY-like chemotaxis protein